MSMKVPETGNVPLKDTHVMGVDTPHRGGLEGVVAATTAISKVDGAAGRLIYRGYDIHDLARTTSYEEVAYLLWFGHLPNRQELEDLSAKLVAERTIPDRVLRTLRN